MRKEIIKLKDMSVIDIETDQDYRAGCETCDYGSCYTTEITFYFNDSTNVTYQNEEMYDYGMSMSDIFKAVLNHVQEFEFLTKEQFIKEMKKWLNEEACSTVEIV